jgi:uncharacterized protein
MTTVMWKNRDEIDYSIEYFELDFKGEVNILRGTVTLLLDRNPALVSYEIICDTYWKTRSVRISQSTSNNKNKNIDLKVSQDQIWRKYDKEASSYSSKVIDIASEIYDVDLQITPATNTLPINRLGLNVGESQEIYVLWIGFPNLELEQQGQKYSRIDDSHYKFEIPSTRFNAKLEVDKLGLVVTYNNLWHRLS